MSRQCGRCEQSMDHLPRHDTMDECFKEALAEIELLSKELLEARAVLRRMRDDWSDVGQRLQNAEKNLRAMADEAVTYENGKRLRDKASGVALSRDYLRGYGHDR